MKVAENSITGSVVKRKQEDVADLDVRWECVGKGVWNDCHWSLLNTTHFKVSLLLQVEQAKQLTHQALFRAETTVGKKYIYEKDTHTHTRTMIDAITYFLLTVSFDDTVAVVANVSKQLSVTKVTGTQLATL